MNCTEVRAHLPSLPRGGLEPASRGEVEKHLAECPACRQEQAVLEQTCRLLDTVPAPVVHVDLVRLYREAGAEQARRARRWRRVAVALSAAAALLVIVTALLQLEIRVEAQQMVLRWGSPPVQPPVPSAVTPPVQVVTLAPEDLQRLAALEDQVRLVGQIAHALADNADTRDRLRQQDIARLRERLEELQRQTSQRWTAAREYAEALFTAKLSLPRQGVIP